MSVCIYQYPQRQEDGVESPRIEATGSCEPSLKLQIILGYKKTMAEIYLVQQH